MRYLMPHLCIRVYAYTIIFNRHKVKNINNLNLSYILRGLNFLDRLKPSPYNQYYLAFATV
jgi:hypothetical protein